MAKCEVVRQIHLDDIGSTAEGTRMLSNELAHLLAWSFDQQHFHLERWAGSSENLP